MPKHDLGIWDATPKGPRRHDMGASLGDPTLACAQCASRASLALTGIMNEDLGVWVPMRPQHGHERSASANTPLLRKGVRSSCEFRPIVVHAWRPDSRACPLDLGISAFPDRLFLSFDRVQQARDA